MKKFSRLFLVGGLATAMFLGYGLAKAQDQNPPADDQSGDHPAMQDGDHGNHGDWGKYRIEHLKDKLGLTDDQAAQLKEAFKKQQEANKPLRDQEKIDMDTLQQKVDMKASDSDIKTLLDKLKDDQKQMEQVQENSMDKMRTILTPTQQAKWVLSMHRGPMGHGKWDGKKGDWKKRQDGGDNDAAQPTPGEAPVDTPAGN
ncbi:MAG TPA: Spy/CpxP family protein refolding chaperone [bacterium]|nr:Spy/CpxP family protein refolding chaperone [bacterium]